MNKISVKDFGAVCNDELQTSNIQNAIDHCFLQGGGEVVIPTGDYLVSSLRIRSNVTLHLEKDAHLIGSRNPRDYDIKEDLVEPYKSSKQ